MTKKIIYILLVFIIGIFFLEGVTRFFLLDDESEPVVPGVIGQFDEYLGWSLKPNSDADSRRTGYHVKYHINSKGIRDKETTYEKPDSVFRIVLLGDSRSFGFGIPMEKHFPHTLEGYFKNLQVINMGVSGYGLDQMLIFLRREGFKYNPDLVMLYIAHYGNHRHLHSRRYGKEKPRFKLENGELVLKNSPILKPQKNVVQEINGWFRTHSKVYEIFYEAFKGLTSDQKESAVIEDESDEKNFQNETFRKELYELGEALVFQIAKETSEFGARFVLINQIEALHKACQQKNILSLNVSRALLNPNYALKDDLGHFNEDGSGVLGWEIAEFFHEKNLIPAEHLVTPKPKY